MHGLGNDFVIIDGRADNFVPDAHFCITISDRRSGIGCDQVIVMNQPEAPGADVFMRVYNLDGSEARACGNATRCVARLLFEEAERSKVVVQTVVGLLKTNKNKNGTITADMGLARLAWDEIPLLKSHDTLHVPLTMGSLADACCVNIGNPHAIFFVQDVTAIPLAEYGPMLETDTLFPGRCNIEIAQVLSPERIRMRVWERGSGITRACGSAACATLVAAVRRSLSASRATIVMDGGDVTVEWRDNGHVYLTGPTAKVFKGVFDDEFLAQSLSQDYAAISLAG